MDTEKLFISSEMLEGRLVTIAPQLYRPPQYGVFDSIKSVQSMCVIISAKEVADLEEEGLQGYNAFECVSLSWHITRSEDDRSHLIRNVRWSKALVILLIVSPKVCHQS